MRGVNHMEEPKPPIVLLEEIEKIEGEFKKYISGKLIKYGKNKILVTIPRKGHVIIDHLKQEDREIEAKLKDTFGDYIVSAEEFFEMTKLHDKELIVFDDAVDEGVKIGKFLKDYQKYLDKSDEEFSIIQKKNIRIGAFVVNEMKYSSLLNEGKLDAELIGSVEPEEHYRFLKQILNIITYLIHSGDIIDPDHLLIKGSFTEYVPYSKIWTILKNTNEKIYEADFGFYHPGKKKITLYDIPYFKWIDTTRLNILDKKFQCKVRFVFDIFQDNQNLFVKNFSIVPVINPQIKIGWSQDCNSFERQFCKNYKKLPEHFCVDCVLYKLIISVMRGFMEKWHGNLEKNNIETSEEIVTWRHMNNTYEKSFQPRELKKQIFP